MFTGIIEGSGTVKGIESKGQGKVLHISCDLDLSESKTGDSIAVNGVCLTAVSIEKNSFTVDVAPETIDRTTFKHLTAGEKVNLERALRLSDRLDGHLVSGHIDGTGKIRSIKKQSNALIITIDVSDTLAADMIEKGSVAIEGISLTINSCSDNDFEISIIPHTANITTIGLKRPGDRVNIETDMIGKYVRKIVKSNVPAKDISMELLARNGFL